MNVAKKKIQLVLRRFQQTFSASSHAYGILHFSLRLMLLLQSQMILSDKTDTATHSFPQHSRCFGS